jgi:hypothetical protein
MVVARGVLAALAATAAAAACSSLEGGRGPGGAASSTGSAAGGLLAEGTDGAALQACGQYTSTCSEYKWAVHMYIQ